jgi:hypothetical protein
MREAFTRERLVPFMNELARTAPVGGPWRVYLVGGSTAVVMGWRASSVDIDLCSDQPDVFRDIQAIKERLDLNIEFARPEDFVPPLRGSPERHVHIDTVGTVSFLHYDPYAQLLSKVVRGFQRDLADARHLVASGMVDPAEFRKLVAEIPDSAYSRYPNLSRGGVEEAVTEFLAGTG